MSTPTDEEKRKLYAGERLYSAAEVALERAALLREIAKKLQKQAEEYGCEHGQVDPTTGVWEATELEMQYCETLETAAQEILAIHTDQSALARVEAAAQRQLMQGMHDDLENCLREGKNPVLLLVVWRDVIATLQDRDREAEK